MEEEDTKLCNNCKRQISANNFMIHEMHCRRHIVLCDKCKEPVHRAEMEQHLQESHAKINCGQCGMAMEKDQLEEHEKNVCLKAKKKCLFCELEVTRGEFDNHTDFCGSRTEQCFKCKQYIMLKDQDQHEISNCTYPAPKPSNTSSPQNNNTDPFLFNHEENYVDPFTFEEISRMLNQTAITRPVGRVNTNPTGLIPKETNVGVKKTNIHRNTNHRMDKVPSSVNTAVTSTKKPLGTKRLIGGNDRRKVDTNRQREMGSNSANRYGATGPKVKPQPADDLDSLIRELEKPRKPLKSQVVDTSNFSPHGYNQAEIDEMSMIPCEFCGNPYPTEELFHHQSSCTDDPLSSMAPQFITNQLREETPLSPTNAMAEREERVMPMLNPEPVPIINNLREGEESNWFLSQDHSLMREQTMLPCEFCDELYPGDTLCQHQAVCDANSEMTPTLMSPVNTNPYSTKKTLLKNKLEQPSTVTRNHQASPLMDSSDDEINLNMQSSPPNEHVNNPGTWALPYDLRSTLQKYGVDADRGNDLHLRPHGYGHYTQNSSDEETDKNRAPARLEPRRDSAERTRRTLNQLLQENDNSKVNDYDLLAHMTVGNKGRRGHDVQGGASGGHGAASSTKKPAPHSSNKGAKPVKVKKTVSARDVQQELDNQSFRVSAATPQSRSHTRTRVGADQNAQPGNRPRQRSRANYMFSNGSSSYKTENKVPSRRTGDRS